MLVTGFEPFGGEETNPSGLVAQALDGRTIVGAAVSSVVLPCTFRGARTALKRAIRGADLVISVGQAGGRAEIAVERVAINIEDARIADNAGDAPIDRPIERRGPVGYWSTLPIKAIVAALRAESIPAAVSQSAGTFVCNQVFYALMHALRDRPAVRGGFVHVPYLPAQAARLGGGAPSMPLDMATFAIEIAIATALRARRDVRVTGGTTH